MFAILETEEQMLTCYYDQDENLTFKKSSSFQGSVGYLELDICLNDLCIKLQSYLCNHTALLYKYIKNCAGLLCYAFQVPASYQYSNIGYAA